MPPALHVNKVLVSGASGFIAAWIVRTLLERGHHVRGTVRSASKGDYLKRLFEDYGSNFQYVIVKDIANEGAFDDAVKDMDAVVHTASPFHFRTDDPQEIIGPAIKGTTSILESVLKFGTKVRRVVITSSSVAMAITAQPHLSPKHATYTEKDWNFKSVEVVNQMGKGASSFHKYMASKVLAERAAWEFMGKHEAEIGWDLVTIHPPWVLGPFIHDVSSESQLHTSGAFLLAFLKNDPPPTEDLALPADNFVDVRDLAWAHAEALVNGNIGGKNKEAAFNEGKGRLAMSAGPFAWQDVVDAITASSESLPPAMPTGEPGAGKTTVHPLLIDTSRARDVLGVKFRPHHETFVDVFESFKEKGLI